MLEKKIDLSKKRKLELYNSLKKAFERQRETLGSDEKIGLLKDVLGVSMSAGWLLDAIVKGRISNLSRIRDYLEFHDAAVVFEGREDDYLHQSILDLARKRARSNDFMEFTPFAKLSEDEKKLERLTISGREPASQADWGKVSCVIAFKMEFIKPLREFYPVESFVYDDDKTSIRGDFKDLLNESGELEKKKDLLDQDLMEAGVTLAKILDDIRKENLEVESMESKLVYSKCIVSLNEKMDDRSWQTLEKLIQTLDSFNDGCGDVAGKPLEFRKILKEAIQFMPFVTATPGQIVDLLSPGQTFELGILDEASQSSSTEILSMMYFDQFLVVGDDQQGKPSTASFSQEQMTELEKYRKGVSIIPDEMRLDGSLFHLCAVAIPRLSKMLEEHFRSRPEIIQAINHLFYDGMLNPLRSRSLDQDCLLDRIFEQGEREAFLGTNFTEAIETANLICKTVNDSMNDPTNSQPTILAISMGGHRQCNLIKELVEKNIGKLSHMLADHRILYATPGECQGGERDLVIINWVDSPKKSGADESRKLVRMQNEKELNVATTRAKNKLVHMRSFGLYDLEPEDCRSKYFRCISKAAAFNSGRSVTPVPVHFDPETEFRHHLIEGIMDTLLRRGFVVAKNGGKMWPDSLLVQSSASKDRNVLLQVDCHTNESEWEKLNDQQSSLERAGRVCLRVDGARLASCFYENFTHLLEFLKEHQVQPSNKRKTGNESGYEPPLKERKNEP